jgi:hypothetical protein
MPEYPTPYDGEFLRCIVGSRLSGISIDASSDTDLLGIRIESPDQITGLHEFEQSTWRSQPAGIRSGPDDIDLTVYGLQKFMRLAVQGNPSILATLFVPPEFRLIDLQASDALRAMTPMILSRRAGPRFLGYLIGQKRRLLGQEHGRVRAGAILASAAYDGKYAAHMVRLGLQGVELLSTGHITLPMVEDEREYCKAVRRCDIPLDAVLSRTSELEEQLATLQNSTNLPDRPDMAGINEQMHTLYVASWNSV